MSIVHMSVILCYIVALIGLMLYRRLKGAVKLLILYAFISGTMEIVGGYIARRSGNNHIYFNIYIILDFLIMLFALKDFLGRSFKWIALTEISVFVAGYLLELHINSIGYFMRHTLITYMAMLAINNLIILRRTLSIPNLRSTGVYLISISGLLYYCSVIPRFGLHKSLSKDYQLDDLFNNIAVAADMMRFFAVAVAFYFLSRAERQSKAGVVLTDQR